LLFALLLLCFLQLLTEFLAGIYALGLLDTRVPPEVACVVLLLAPATLLIRPSISPRSLVLIGELMLLSRLASLTLETPARMLAAGIGTAAFLVFLPGLLARFDNRCERGDGCKLGLALALTTLVSVFLGSIDSGNAIIGFSARWLLDGLLAGVAAVMLWSWGWARVEADAPAPATARASGGWRIVGLCLGVMGVMAILYLGVAVPAVTARWMDGHHLTITAMTAGAAALFIAVSVLAPGLPARLGPRAMVAWNLLFLSALGMALWSSRIPFPSEGGVYPLPDPPIGPAGRIGLYLMLLLSPILYLNFGRCAGALAAAGPSMWMLGFGFTLGAVWLLLLILGQVFTTAYDYVPVVGPLFRDRFWLVQFVAGLGAVLPVLLARARAGEAGPGRTRGAVGLPIVTAVALALGSLAAVVCTQARPGLPPSGASIRVMTFNLQQGCNAAGSRNFKGQLEFIRQVRPDIVGLQETDTARIAGGNADLVRFLGDGLNFHAHAGPRTSAGTFGIALLSRFPIERTRVFYLHSIGEQTAVLDAEIRVSERVYRVFVTHLGNGGPTSQQREVLELVAGKTNVILMGDFNFRPGAEPYRLTLERLDDAWLTARERRVDPPHQDIERRIDHVFLSREAPVARAEYLDAGASDHPAVVVNIDLSEALPQTKEAREQLVAAGWQPRSPAPDASLSGAAARRQNLTHLPRISSGE